MPVRLGIPAWRFLRQPYLPPTDRTGVPSMEIVPGTTLHTLLVYAVSEPGEWSAESIHEDLPHLEIDEVRRAIRILAQKELVHENSTDHRLWPRREGKAILNIAS
jgi:hypothetical protein